MGKILKHWFSQHNPYYTKKSDLLHHLVTHYSINKV